MAPTTTTTRLGKALAGALAAGALLVPVAQAKPVPGTMLRGSDGAFERAVNQQQRLDSLGDVTVLRASDGAFERAVLQQQALGSVAGYRDAQHAVRPASGPSVYPDAFERALHLRHDQPVAGGGSPTGDGSFDWDLLEMVSSLGLFGAALAGGALLTIRRTRLA